MNLKDLDMGNSAVICQVGGKGELRQHFLDMVLFREPKLQL